MLYYDGGDTQHSPNIQIKYQKLFASTLLVALMRSF